MIRTLSATLVFLALIASSARISYGAFDALGRLVAQSADGAMTTLQKNIEEKSAELQRIQAEREALEKTLKVVSDSSDSITKDIQTYNANINQLGLSIKANTVTIEKLGYEITSLADEIDTMDERIVRQREVIGKLFTELQQNEQETLMARLLKSKSLSDTISAMQNIRTLNESLSSNIEEMRALQTDYTGKIADAKQKRVSREVQKSNLTNLQQIAAHQKSEKQKFLSVTKNQERYYEEQIAELDRKQEEINAIMEEIEHQLRSTFDPTLLPLVRSGVIGFPVEDRYVTQCYGQTKAAMTLYRTKTHNGVDFGGPIGTPVLAVESGTVMKVGNNDRGISRWNKYQYGKYIVIKHENNLMTLYGHLSRQSVKEGSTVEKGQVIGYIGNTGYSKGAHLHLTVFWAPSVQYKSIPPAAGVVPVGITIDPTDYLPSLFQIPKARDAGCK
jgi:murein DD-endopeptidase MepM/ murein hydrolase activator NlpD